MRALAVLPPDRWMEINLLATLRQYYCDELQVFTYPGGMGTWDRNNGGLSVTD